jgi:hypothetical protein
MNKDYPKISEVIELLSESEPIGTKEDRFARGSNELDSVWVIRLFDYILTALYLSAYILVVGCLLFKMIGL